MVESLRVTKITQNGFRKQEVKSSFLLQIITFLSTVQRTILRRKSERVAPVGAVLTVGSSHARYPSGNRTLSIWMGQAAIVALRYPRSILDGPVESVQALQILGAVKAMAHQGVDDALHFRRDGVALDEFPDC